MADKKAKKTVTKISLIDDGDRIKVEVSGVEVSGKGKNISALFS